MALKSVWPFADADDLARDRLGQDPNTGIQTERWGGFTAQDWRVYRSGITADDDVAAFTLLDAARPFIKQPKIEWLVLAPPSVTSYTITVIRYIFRRATDTHGHSKGFTFHRGVTEEVIAVSAGADRIVQQTRQSDPCALAITDITPASPSDAPTGVARPHNPAGVPPGFMVFWRPASLSS